MLPGLCAAAKIKSTLVCPVWAILSVKMQPLPVMGRELLSTKVVGVTLVLGFVGVGHMGH